jgi:predicted RNA-binding Zn ribbon-like protein
MVDPLPDGPPAQDPGTPAEMRGLIDFLNSRASPKRAERFDSGAHAEDFLSRCDLGYRGGPLSEPDTARLRELRDALMRAIDKPAAAEPWATVNRIAAGSPMHLHAAPGPTVGLQAAAEAPVDTVIVSVLDRLANVITTGRWKRLGACARCRRVFYDNTRSHTRRWCSYATCGNRANVASYRQRARSN